MNRKFSEDSCTEVSPSQMRYVQGYDINTDKMIGRFDILCYHRPTDEPVQLCVFVPEKTRYVFAFIQNTENLVPENFADVIKRARQELTERVAEGNLVVAPPPAIPTCGVMFGAYV